MGHADAQSLLGFMYAKGYGVPVNNVRAYMRWSLAKAQGDENAAEGLDIVKKQMSPAQISKAQTLASEWREKLNNYRCAVRTALSNDLLKFGTIRRHTTLAASS